MMKKLNLWKRFCGSNKPNTQKSRSLKIETLEERQLLSVSPDYNWYTMNSTAAEYEIDTAEELVALANIVNGLDDQTADSFSGKTIKLTGDIDLKDVQGGEWTPIGTETNFFAGNFDGMKHSITNFNITEFKFGSYWVNAGLFGWVRGDSTHNSSIKNVNLSGNISISWDDPGLTPATGEGFGNAYVGLLVAEGAGYGVIENCSVDGTIQLKYTGTKTENVDFQVGGVVGDFWTSNMNNVSSSVKITLETANNARKANVGGVIGISTGDGDEGWGNIKNSSYNGPQTESYNISVKNGGNVNGGGFGGLIMNVNSDISDKLTVNNAKLYIESTASYVQAGGLYGAKNGGSAEKSPVGQVTNCMVDADVTARSASSYAITGGLIGGISGGKNGTIANNTFTGNVDVKTTATGAIKVYVGGVIGCVWNNEDDNGNGFYIVDNHVGEGSTIKSDSNGTTGFTNIGGMIGNIENTNIRVIQNNTTDIPTITASGPAITQGFVVGITKATTSLLIDQDMVDGTDLALIGNSTGTVTYILAEDITFTGDKKLKFTNNQYVVLDLNGFKLSGSADSVIENMGNLTITDSSDSKSGCVENTATTAAGYAITNRNKLEIQAGKYIGKNNDQTAEALNLQGNSATTIIGGSYSCTDSNAYYTKSESSTITYLGCSAVSEMGTTENEIRFVSAKIRITSGSGGVTTDDNLPDALINAQSDSTLVLTEGEYEINEEVRTIDKNLVIKGEGKVVIKFATDRTQSSSFFGINTSATISFENVIFTGSTAGLFYNKGSLTLNNCAIVNNSGNLIEYSFGSLQITNTIFANNNSLYLIDNTDAPTTFKMANCTFVKNSSMGDGAIITLNTASNEIYNCVFVDNSNNAGLTNAPISGNYTGSGNYIDDTTTPSIFSNGGYPSNDADWITWDGKFTKAASVFINTGVEPDPVKALLGISNDNWNDATDYNENPRKRGSAIDIGAYEYKPANFDSAFPAQISVQQGCSFNLRCNGADSNGSAYTRYFVDLNGDGISDKSGASLNILWDEISSNEGIKEYLWLAVENSLGEISEMRQVAINVIETLPSIAVKQYNFYNDQIVKLDISAFCYGSSIQQWTVNWGDSISDQYNNYQSNSLSTAHYYSAAPQTYSITLNLVTNGNGSGITYTLGFHTITAAPSASVIPDQPSSSAPVSAVIMESALPLDENESSVSNDCIVSEICDPRVLQIQSNDIDSDLSSRSALPMILPSSEISGRQLPVPGFDFLSDEDEEQYDLIAKENLSSYVPKEDLTIAFSIFEDDILEIL